MNIYGFAGSAVLHLAIIIPSILAAFDVMFERIEQLNGTELVDVQAVRVRKFNRTISVLDGVLKLKVTADDKHEMTVRVEHSAMGNSRFNVYPMKLAPKTVCDFFNTTWRDYYEYFEETTNFPEIGECPMEGPKDYFINNLVLDSNIFPPYLPKGLWRLNFIVKYTGQEKTLVHIRVYFKAEEKGIF